MATTDTQELYELVEENNQMLKKMRRNMRISSIFRIVYWAAIIGSAVGLYYYLQPFVEIGRQNIDQIQSAIQGIRDAADSLPSLDFGSIFSQLGGGGGQ